MELTIKDHSWTSKPVPNILRKSAWLFSKYTGLDIYKWISAAKTIQFHIERPFDFLPLSGIGAEIGVFRGFHACSLLKRHKAIEELYCVDEYVPYGGIEGGELDNLEEAKEDARNRISKFGYRASFLYRNSPECYRDLPPLDFCYLDANHSHKAVKRDLEAVWPSMKHGSWLGGHDYCPGFTGTILAVNEFTLEKDLELNVWTPDWWVKVVKK